MSFYFGWECTTLATGKLEVQTFSIEYYEIGYSVKSFCQTYYILTLVVLDMELQVCQISIRLQLSISHYPLSFDFVVPKVMLSWTSYVRVKISKYWNSICWAPSRYVACLELVDYRLETSGMMLWPCLQQLEAFESYREATKDLGVSVRYLCTLWLTSNAE